jgi:hypothetical protein
MKKATKSCKDRFFLIEQNQLNKDIRDKIVTDDAVLQHIKELNEKLTFFSTI